MPGFLSPRKGVPLLLIPEYSGINKGQRVPDRSKTAHRKPLVKCFLTGSEGQDLMKAIQRSLHCDQWSWGWQVWKQRDHSRNCCKQVLEAWIAGVTGDGERWTNPERTACGRSGLGMKIGRQGRLEGTRRCPVWANRQAAVSPGITLQDLALHHVVRSSSPPAGNLGERPLPGGASQAGWAAEGNGAHSPSLAASSSLLWENRSAFSPCFFCLEGAFLWGPKRPGLWHAPVLSALLECWIVFMDRTDGVVSSGSVHRTYCYVIRRKGKWWGDSSERAVEHVRAWRPVETALPLLSPAQTPGTCWTPRTRSLLGFVFLGNGEERHSMPRFPKPQERKAKAPGNLEPDLLGRCWAILGADSQTLWTPHIRELGKNCFAR